MESIEKMLEEIITIKQSKLDRYVEANSKHKDIFSQDDIDNIRIDLLETKIKLIVHKSTIR